MSVKTDESRQKQILLLVLGLNAALFVGLGVAGWLADSSALLANAVDNASDSAVYLISFLAVGRSPAWKTRAARVSGVLLLVFAAGVIADVARRWLTGAEPLGPTMMVMAVVAAGVNLWCLLLLKRVRTDDVNMRAAETFSFNDFISNGGILVAGGLVMWLGRSWPDLVVGALVALMAVKGGLEILKDAKETREEATP
ncbi:MAG: cation transporter [Alphaproteobacteria bacterium]|uniref:cation transporter n=1 Tax=unclassified Brevundimonas TaxID=2622653 RepID=UPI0004A8F7D3|nr:MULTISPECIES: cation transporter [unclassified Brevundimonas]MBU1376882.1 cation transporter [Alphaproteobacteria bacterium]KDP94883.1 RND transporter [Brevundimonas sp. EAKA]MBU1515136.1 cation transporter [Alphaproteobacteria bacterium]MBU2031079.1 cation transporter [Alphaproteobacteria bacterium]MBU2164725.1 cation transporter [Alphaproteobacteria bacterium]